MAGIGMNIYLQLTETFNRERLRAIICGGQAVVLHRLAIMSKDGDWILREDDEALSHVLSVLDSCGARYRFGAPLDVRWMAGGWSAHFEFRQDNLRVRTDFFTRPSRIPETKLPQLWQEQADQTIPFVNIRRSGRYEEDQPRTGLCRDRRTGAADDCRRGSDAVFP